MASLLLEFLQSTPLIRVSAIFVSCYIRGITTKNNTFSQIFLKVCMYLAPFLLVVYWFGSQCFIKKLMYIKCT